MRYECKCAYLFFKDMMNRTQSCHSDDGVQNDSGRPDEYIFLCCEHVLKIVHLVVPCPEINRN